MKIKFIHIKYKKKHIDELEKNFLDIKYIKDK